MIKLRTEMYNDASESVLSMTEMIMVGARSQHLA